MARTFGAVYLRIWRDQDWRTLSHTEQYLYWTLIFQPKLNRAGLLEYSPRRWAEGNSTLTVPDVEATIKSLELRGYVVLDEGTNELLIRTYVRNDEAWKQPKVMASVVSAANEIESPKLRYALLLELDRIPVDELSDSPGPNNGPSIRSKVQKSIAQLRVILGGGHPGGSGGGQRPEGDRTDGYRYPTDTPGIPDAKGTGAPVDTRPVATSQRPAPTPAPEPAPEPAAASVQGSAPLALFDAAPAARADEEAKESELNAGTLVAEWLEYRKDERPSGRIIGRVGAELKHLLEVDEIPYQVVREGFQAWESKGLDPAKIGSCVNEVQSARRKRAAAIQGAPNVVSIEAFAARQLPSPRAAANDLGSDEHMARFLARQGIDTTRRTS